MQRYSLKVERLASPEYPVLYFSKLVSWLYFSPQPSTAVQLTLAKYNVCMVCKVCVIYLRDSEQFQTIKQTTGYSSGNMPSRMDLKYHFKVFICLPQHIYPERAHFFSPGYPGLKNFSHMFTEFIVLGESLAKLYFCQIIGLAFQHVRFSGKIQTRDPHFIFHLTYGGQIFHQITQPLLTALTDKITLLCSKKDIR